MIGSVRIYSILLLAGLLLQLSNSENNEIVMLLKKVKEPTLHQIFGFPEESAPQRSNSIKKHISKFRLNQSYFMNLFTITDQEYKKKMIELEQEIKRPKYDDTNSKHLKSRRQMPREEYRSWEWSAAYVYTAAEQLTRNMLSLIYLAREIAKDIFKHPLYDPYNIAFRVGFVYLKLHVCRRYIWELVSLITDFDTIEGKKTGYQRYVYYKTKWSVLGYWVLQAPQFETDGKAFNVYDGDMLESRLREHYHTPTSYNPIDYLRLLANMIRWHAEFEYLFAILARLHDRYCNRTHIYMTKPTTLVPTTAGGWWGGK